MSLRSVTQIGPNVTLKPVVSREMLVGVRLAWLSYTRARLLQHTVIAELWRVVDAGGTNALTATK